MNLDILYKEYKEGSKGSKAKGENFIFKVFSSDGQAKEYCKVHVL